MKAEDLKYLESHEWVAVGTSGGQQVATIGISAFAVEQLGDIVHIELPGIGDSVTAGEEFGEVESVKAVSSLYSPVTGQVLEVHAGLVDDLSVLSDDPYERGWLLKVKVDSLSDRLLDFAAYKQQCDSH
ncbi:MAG: glycine cleavage system protein GcvH [Planctomycetaceae bacterium]|nr:glycine cleavage system protein GcvH [Planctomycetaceae bacterium]